MDGHEEEFDQLLAQSFQNKEDGSSTMSFTLKIDGQIGNNAFQNLQFGVGLQFQMQAEGTDISPQPSSDTESPDPIIPKTNDTKKFPLINISVFICCICILISALNTKHKITIQ
jgi:hypothetical protein